MLSWENGIRIEVGVQTLVPVRCYRIVGVVSFCVVGAGDPGVKRPQSQPRPPGQRPQKTRARMRPKGGRAQAAKGYYPKGTKPKPLSPMSLATIGWRSSSAVRLETAHGPVWLRPQESHGRPNVVDPLRP